MSKLILLFIYLSFLASCDPDVAVNPYLEEPIVECILLVGKGIEKFKFTRTLPVGSVFDNEKAGITGAEIIITDKFNRTTVLKPLADKPGIYTDLNYIIEPKAEYFLQINYQGSVITARTVTPDTFTVSENYRTSFVYLQDEIKFEWTESQGCAAYYFTVTNLETARDKIDQGLIENTVGAWGRTRFFFTLRTNTVVYPWLHNYYGRHKIEVFAIDDILYNFLQTSFQDIRQLTEPESSVKNAIGYFAAGVAHSRFYSLLKQ